MVGIQARGAGVELQELYESKGFQKAGTCDPGKNEPYCENPRIAPSVIPACRGKDVLKAGSCVLVWAEDECAPKVGDLQAAPRDSERGSPSGVGSAAGSAAWAERSRTSSTPDICDLLLDF